MTGWFHRYLPSPDFHRLDWQHYGLRANHANDTNGEGLANTAASTNKVRVPNGWLATHFLDFV
jgi:hypothetical protein